MNPRATAAALATAILCATLRAQDLEPRAYSNSPTGMNFAIAGYGYVKGSVLTDPSLPLDNVSNEAHVAIFAYATTLNVLGKSAKFDMIIPYTSLAAKGLVFGLPRARYVNGFADPAFRFSMNFIGAPALTASEFKDYRQDFILGASLRVTAPLGQYDNDKLVNIGTNRWSFKPEIGMSKAFGHWTVELTPGVTFYTDNGDFFGGKTRQVAPLVAIEAGVTYTLIPGGWLALNAGYFKGGRTTVDDVENLDQQEGMRFGATLALPVNRYNSVKLYGITGYNAHQEHDFQAVGIAWQVRWGGGYSCNPLHHMKTLIENIAQRLSEVWHSPETPRRGHTHRCQCGRPIFFRNSQCLACNAQLGYEPDLAEVRALAPGPEAGTWWLAGKEVASPTFRRCANLDSPAGCNWLLPAEHPSDLCISCRLNRTIPKLDDADNCRYWRSIENAKRRLVAQLLSVGLPVRSKVEDDPERGVMFDFLRSPPNGPRVMTSHGCGLITLNVEEADDSIREKTRHQLNEPYRTLLGHFRHEIGHYYWDRLIAGTPWHAKFRELFGDESADYGAALRANYQNGPPPDWRNRHITAYASVHPWEDWAECWAHYLHLVDSLDTAMGFGLSGDDIEAESEPFKLDDLYEPKDPDAKRVLSLVNAWMELITALNEMARSMGHQDFYPFTMSRPVLRKLHFIQLVVKNERQTADAG